MPLRVRRTQSSLPRLSISPSARGLPAPRRSRRLQTLAYVGDGGPHLGALLSSLVLAAGAIRRLALSCVAELGLPKPGNKSSSGGGCPVQGDNNEDGYEGEAHAALAEEASSVAAGEDALSVLLRRISGTLLSLSLEEADHRVGAVPSQILPAVGALLTRPGGGRLRTLRPAF